jgi:hypothetical protein
MQTRNTACDSDYLQNPDALFLRARSFSAKKKLIDCVVKKHSGFIRSVELTRCAEIEKIVLLDG